MDPVNICRRDLADLENQLGITGSVANVKNDARIKTVNESLRAILQQLINAGGQWIRK
jgi:hypothetical protein